MLKWHAEKESTRAPPRAGPAAEACAGLAEAWGAHTAAVIIISCCQCWLSRFCSL
jgi:hypothetical protein